MFFFYDEIYRMDKNVRVKIDYLGKKVISDRGIVIVIIIIKNYLKVSYFF